MTGTQLDITKTYEENYDEHLKNIIQILIERKYCYTTPEQKSYYEGGIVQSAEDGSYPISNYRVYDSDVAPPILRHRSGNMQLDDFLKENVINNFTQILLNQLVVYEQLAMLNAVNSSLSNSNLKLVNHQDKMINNLNKDIQILSNKKHNKITSYSRRDYSKHQYQFYMKLIVNTLFVFAIIFTLNTLTIGSVPVFPKNMILYVNSILIGVFIIYMMLSLNASRDRNKTNWNQFNFRNIKIEENV